MMDIDEEHYQRRLQHLARSAAAEMPGRRRTDIEAEIAIRAMHAGVPAKQAIDAYRMQQAGTTIRGSGDLARTKWHLRHQFSNERAFIEHVVKQGEAIGLARHLVLRALLDHAASVGASLASIRAADLMPPGPRPSSTHSSTTSAKPRRDPKTWEEYLAKGRERHRQNMMNLATAIIAGGRGKPDKAIRDEALAAAMQRNWSTAAMSVVIGEKLRERAGS